MIQSLLSNLDVIFAVLLATHGLAATIVNLTPTPRDDVLVGKFYRGLEFIAGIWTKEAKLLPGENAALLSGLRHGHPPENFTDLAKDLLRIPR